LSNPRPGAPEDHRAFPHGPVRSRHAIFDHIVARDVVPQLLAAVGKQSVVDRELPAVLHPLNTLRYRSVSGIVSICIGRRRHIDFTPPQFRLQLADAKIKDGAYFILAYEGELIARRVDRRLTALPDIRPLCIRVNAGDR
jgi:hypothetical protein